MKTININEATGPQLISFAQNVLNIEGIRPSMSKDEMRAKIRLSGYDKDTIEVEDASPVKQASPEGEQAEEKMVTIIIPSDDKAGGDQPVWVSVNTKGMYIPRDQECRIPARYEEALRHAVRDVYKPLEGGGLSEPKKVPSYSYSRVA